MHLKLTVIGHLGGDPDMRYFPDGTAVTSFSLATTRKWTTDSGQKMEETTWLRCSVRGKRAEAANQYLTKGSKIFVEGRLKPDPNTGGPRLWQRQDGTVAASYEMVVESFVFLGSSEGRQGGHAAVPQEDGYSDAGMGQGGAIDEDDIPF
jgi:single-strand DNA-binding protein